MIMKIATMTSQAREWGRGEMFSPVQKSDLRLKKAGAETSGMSPWASAMGKAQVNSCSWSPTPTPGNQCVRGQRATLGG